MTHPTGSSITLQAADGHRLEAWRAAPGGAVRGGVVVLQEIFGLNAHTRHEAEHYAADGFLAVWHMNNGTVLDSSPNANNETYRNRPDLINHYCIGPEHVSNYVTEEGAQVLLPDMNAIGEMLKQMASQ